MTTPTPSPLQSSNESEGSDHDENEHFYCLSCTTELFENSDSVSCDNRDKNTPRHWICLKCLSEKHLLNGKPCLISKEFYDFCSSLKKWQFYCFECHPDSLPLPLQLLHVS